MHLFVDISSHGFGHLSITAPVLNRLAEMAPDFRLTVRSALPENKLRERIHLPFNLIRDCSDFGYLMHDATRINREASGQAYREVHAHWPARVAEEALFLSRVRPDLVLSNVSYLPLAGAAQAGLPAASLCSLNWADLFEHFFAGEAQAARIHGEILAAYRSARCFIRVTPGMPMNALGNVDKVGPIAQTGQKHDLGLDGERVVLIAMGGIRHHIPVDRWPQLPGIRWLVSQTWQCTHPDARAFEPLGLSFTDLLCSVDAIITKPGYGTFAEAACNGTPVLFQRREDWPEQDCLIDWLNTHGHCHEISGQALESGAVEPALRHLWQKTPPARPGNTGDREAAQILLDLLR